MKKTREIAQYLRVHGVDIKCVEFNFYEGAGKEMVHTDFVVGDPSDEMDEVDDRTAQTWDDALARANEDNRSAVSDLISAAEKRLNPLAAPQNKYYYMRVKGKTKKNLFGAIVCQKKSAYVSFRVDPDTFPHDDNPEIRSRRQVVFRQIYGTEDTPDEAQLRPDIAVLETRARGDVKAVTGMPPSETGSCR